MYHVSNHVLFVLNLSLFMISVPLIVISTTVGNIEKIECVGVVQQPMMVIGILLLLVSVMGMLGCCFRFPTFLWIYLFFLLLLMIGLFCFTMFLYLVTDEKAGLALQDTGFMQHERDSDSPSSWLHIQIGNPNKWVKIRDCMRASSICDRDESAVPFTLSFFGHDLNLIKVSFPLLSFPLFFHRLFPSADPLCSAPFLSSPFLSFSLFFHRLFPSADPLCSAHGTSRSSLYRKNLQAPSIC